MLKELARNFKLQKFLRSSTSFNNILLLVILLVSIFLRFYNAPFRYSFGEDPIRDALISVAGAKSLQLPLTGSFSSLGPFTFGPWYYFQLIIFTFIIRMDYAPWIFMGICSVLFVILMYKIGSYLEDKNLGLILAAISAVAVSQVGTTDLSNPNLVPFYSALSILIFIRVLKYKLSLWWSYFLGITLGISMNIHYQAIGLMIIPFFFLFGERFRFRNFFLILAGIFTTFVPIVIFDLNNHWYTFRNLFFYYTEGRKAIYVPNRWLFYIRDFWPEHVAYSLGLSKEIGALLTLATPIAIFTAFFKRKISKEFIFLIIIFIFNFILLRYYWGQRSSAYLLYLHPSIFIFSGYIFWVFMKINGIYKYISITIFVLLLALMFKDSIKLSNSDSLNKYTHKQASILIEKFPNKKFALYNCGENYKFRTEAIAYILSLENKIDELGFKIGFVDDRCVYPATATYSSYEVTKSAELLNKTYPKIENTDAFDMSLAINRSTRENKWALISPKVIYNSTLRWWFNEQP